MTGRDPDDWFDEPDLSELQDRRVTTREPEDDWLVPEDADADRGPLFGRRAAQIGLVVAILLVVLLAGLAAAGVFSSSAPEHAPVLTTSPPATTRAPTTTAATPAVRLPSGPLKPGDTGADVKLLQRALVRLGDYSGAVDGQYGPATKDAVSRFQTFAHLTADGIAGPQTLKALAAALGNP